ncbi:MAG TPA: cytochrome P450, partial [Pseudonocardiaceae bacterium]
MTSVGAEVRIADLDGDPYPVYRRLRAEQPVCWLPELKQWLITRWSDVATVLREPDVYTTDLPGSLMIQLVGGAPLGAREGRDHQEIRESIAHDYDPHRINDFVDTIARPHAERLMTTLLPAGRADLLVDYFEPAALLAHAELLGIGDTDVARLRRWGVDLVRALTNFQGDQTIRADGQAAMADFGDVLGPVVTRLRAQPDDSLISHLLRTGRTDADLIPVVKQLAQSQLQAGWLGTWALRMLLGHPDQLARVRADRWLVGAAVYEALRWSSPVGVLTRRTTRPVVLSGQEIPANAVLAVSVASANRDETVFAEPDEFDVHRTVRTNLGFGTGEHHCPAFAFVPAIARTSLDVLLDHVSDLRPEPGSRPAPHGWKL